MDVVEGLLSIQQVVSLSLFSLTCKRGGVRAGRGWLAGQQYYSPPPLSFSILLPAKLIANPSLCEKI